MSKPGPRPDPNAEIEQTDIESAVTRSGYPLEIRLLEAFERANMSPQIGTLFRPPDATHPRDPVPAREIDIVAHLSHRQPLGEHDAIYANLNLIVAAKNLAPAAAMVGFKWRDVPKRELELLRSQIGGSPTTVLDGYPEANALACAEGGFCDAFEPLARAPVCVQWAIARRDDAIEQERRYWRDLDVLIRAERANAVGDTHVYLRQRSPVKLLRFQVPVLVVATRTLHVCAALENNKFEQVDWFTVRRTVDLGDRVEERLVEVVTEKGLPNFIEACRRTMDGITALVRARSEEIVSVATAQHAKYLRAMEEAALDAAAARPR
jgi:hypothetical protein